MDARVDRFRSLVTTAFSTHRGKLFDATAVAGSRLVRQGTLFIALAVAARILSKELLGVWALIYIVVQFGVLLSDAGISTFVIREKDLGDRLYSTAVYSCALLSTIVAAVTAAIITPLSGLLGYPGYKIYFLATASAIIPMGINAVLQASLRRHRRFGAILATDVLASAILLAGTVAMLLAGAELWSFVLPTIVASWIGCLATGFVAGFPAYRWDRECLRRIVDYSAGLVGFSTVNFWARNADHVLIGRFLGAEQLSIYAIAYRFMMLPISQITNIAATVALPYMSPHQDDPERLRLTMGKLLSLIGAFVTGPMVFIWLQRSAVVELALGPGWDHVASLLLVLTPLGVFQAFVSPIGLCFQVSGQTRLYFAIGLFQTGMAVVSFVVGVWFGSIEAVVVAYAIAVLLSSPPAVAIGLRTIGSGLGDWVRWCGPHWLCMGICWAISSWTHSHVSTSAALYMDLLTVLTVCGVTSWCTLKFIWTLGEDEA